MTQIYLVRHAEAEGNLYRRVHGWYNSLITENGYTQIRKSKRWSAALPLYISMRYIPAICSAR